MQNEQEHSGKVDEFKTRLSKTQFSFGKHNKDMSQVQSLYSSEIDQQAKTGGLAADGRLVRN